MKKQRGMTAISWVILLTIVGTFVMIGLKLFPVYVEGFTVESIVASLENRGDLSTKRDIVTAIQKRFEVDDVKTPNLKQDLKVERRGNGFLVTIDYERRAPIFGNLSAVAHFKYEVTVVGKGI